MTLLIISDNIILKYEFYKLYIISRELTSNNKQFLATIWPTWREYLLSVMWWRAWSLYSAEPETLFWLTEGDGERERWRWRRGQTQQPSLSVSQSVSQTNKYQVFNKSLTERQSWYWTKINCNNLHSVKGGSCYFFFFNGVRYFQNNKEKNYVTSVPFNPSIFFLLQNTVYVSDYQNHESVD